MIVAACALNREAKHPASDRGEYIIEVIKTALRSVLFPEMHARSRPQESGGNHGVNVLAIQFVAGDLFPNKNVVGFVVVKRADHVVSIHPGIGPIVIVLEAIGVRITRDVQPVPAPALTVVR